MEYDNIKQGTATTMRNGRAFDDLGHSRNGMLIMATLAYTILATNIIMPILKNKLTNRTYKKELELKGETPESIRRKKRYTFNSNASYIDDNQFSEISSVNKFSKSSLYEHTLKNIEPAKTLVTKNSPFDTISRLNSSVKI